MEYTKGEWKVINGHIVASEHGRIQDTVATVFDPPPTSEELANANLIAAAPDMYEALGKTLTCLESIIPSDLVSKSAKATALKEIIKALAKAEGK